MAFGVVALQALLWTAVLVWVRRRIRSVATDVQRRCSASGQEIVLGPASANYGGADFRYSKVRGNGVLCITRRAILFEKALGTRIEIPLADVHEAAEAKSFRGKRSFGSGASYLIFHLNDNNRIGFLVHDAARWKARLISELPAGLP